MKLRLRENSIRLRLLQSEVNQLSATGIVTENITISLNPTEQLIYSLRISNEVENIFARFVDNQLEIILPNSDAEKWIKNDENIGIYETQKISDELELKITVEKDFACLTRPNDVDNEDAFPNPELNC